MDVYNLLLKQTPFRATKSQRKAGKENLAYWKEYASLRKTNKKTPFLAARGDRVPRISSDGNDGRIFWGFNISIRGILG